MAEEEVFWSEDYNKDFDPEWYLNVYMRKVDNPDEPGARYMPFVLNNLHNFFSRDEVKGQRLLDVGSGPCVHLVISGSSKVEDVYLSDFASPNRKILEDWHAGKRDLITHAFDFVVDKEKTGQSGEERMNLLRKKVKGVLFIDITDDSPVSKNPSAPQEFDIITSCTCLESASSTIDGYRKCANNVKGLLKPGGYLALLGVLGDNFYRVKNTKFKCAPVKEDDLKAIYTELGFEIIEFQARNASDAERSEYSDLIGQFAMLARKK